MSITADIERTIRDLNRDQIQKILESNGYAVYDHEDTDELRQTLRDDIAQGIISEVDLDTPSSQLPDCRDR